jgi:site-specific recombinase XerD
MRYEWVERNPIKLVRQSAKRERTPDILQLAELQLFLSKLSVRERTLALLDAATGLRVSELLALRRCDVEFENLEPCDAVDLARSSRQLQDGSLSQTCPQGRYMAENLLRWRRQSGLCVRRSLRLR